MSNQSVQLPSPEEVQSAQAQALSIVEQLNRAILGQEQLTRQVLVGFLSRGHVLLEGLPGLGKTELVKSLAKLLSIEFKRLQFTPDLLPGDITGGNILEQEESGARRMKFHPGPIFTNILLADEINRASPKTQSALLEAMQERRVTVAGETRPLPDPFLVIATQNPIELEGTYPLPEAQLDRFLFKLEVQGVERSTLREILINRRAGEPPQLEPMASAESLAKLFDTVDSIYLPEAVAGYIARLVDATHSNSNLAPEAIKQYVRHGASPRAAIAMATSARAEALMGGKPSVGFDDVRQVCTATVAHRMVLDFSARLDGWTPRKLVDVLLEEVSEVEEELPREMQSQK